MNSIFFRKLFIILFVAIGLVLGIVLWRANYTSAQSGSKDAIAIRVIPNINHYSARVWYAKQNFSGSPQSLTVDGYDAIRDGRSVYVNAANTFAGNLYTNIYLISFNQEAESATVDIFGNILENWKFNTNLNVSDQCVLNNNITCLTDEECPIGDYCNSEKAKVTRDVRRLADISDIEASLERYRSRGYYPKLSAGSYMRNVSLSVWPSWKDTLGREIGGRLAVDPVNKLGACAGYNEDTCWDEVNESFAAALPALPTNSLAYMYNTDADGAVANVCANFESIWTIVAPPSCSLNVCMDYDGDGYGRPASALCTNAELDCDDLNPNITTGAAAETCDNNIDDDCDGLIDCDDTDCPACSTSVFCGDGACNGSETCLTCEGDCGACGAGTCPDGVCDESSECSSGSSPCYGIGLDCGCGNGKVECGEQCDDANNVPGDGCSGICTWECTDNDGDYYIAENTNYADCNMCGLAGNEKCLGNNDCDDSSTSQAPNINPGQPDICNGIDDDCNSGTQDGTGAIAPLNSNQNGVCSGSTQACAGVVGWIDNYEKVGNYELVESRCDDKLDNDCDNTCDLSNNDCFSGSISDSDCTGVCLDTSEANFTVIGEADCNQCDHPGDDDGNQSLGANDPFTKVPITTTDSDWTGAGYSLDWLDKCDPACGPGASVVHLNTFEMGLETKCDGIDNNCDGTIDEGCDDDDDNYCDSDVFVINNFICPNSASDASGDDCNDSDSSVHPGASEICGNGTDEDCVGGDLACGPTCVNTDGDNYGVCPNCGISSGCAADGNDCDDTLSFINPGAPETCDGYDNNCDGAIDEGCDDDNDDYCDDTMTYFPGNFTGSPFPPSDNPCPNSITVADDCNDNNINVNPAGTEKGHCDNNEDDNCNGLKDCADVAACGTDLICQPCCTFTATFPCDLCS